MTQFNIAEAKSHFSELVQKALLGEELVIARDNKPLLKLDSLERERQKTTPRFGQRQDRCFRCLLRADERRGT